MARISLSSGRLYGYECPRFSKSQIVRLLLVIIVMFALGVVAVPLFNGASRVLGIHGNAGDDQRSQRVDESRQVRVKFLSSNAVDMAWGFTLKLISWKYIPALLTTCGSSPRTPQTSP